MVSPERNSEGAIIRDPVSTSVETSDSSDGYTVEIVDAPDTVETGEQVKIEVVVCCNGDQQCRVEEYKLEAMNDPTGPFGFWPVPVLESLGIVGSQKVITEAKYALLPSCSGGQPDGETTFEEAGEWTVKASIADEEDTTSITVTGF